MPGLHMGKLPRPDCRVVKPSHMPGIACNVKATLSSQAPIPVPPAQSQDGEVIPDPGWYVDT